MGLAASVGLLGLLGLGRPAWPWAACLSRRRAPTLAPISPDSSTVFSNLQECQLVELSNGSLVINMRNSHLNPCDCRAQAMSHDGGATWSAVSWAPALIEPTVSAGLVNVEVRLSAALHGPHASKTPRVALCPLTRSSLRWARASSSSQTRTRRTRGST